MFDNKQKNHGLAAVKIDGFTCVSSASQGLHLLNPLASLIWEMSLDGATELNIVQTICQQYDAYQTQVKNDVAVVIAQLNELNLFKTNSSNQRLWGEALHCDSSNISLATSCFYQLAGKVIAIEFGDEHLHSTVNAVIAHLRLPEDYVSKPNMAMRISQQDKYIISLNSGRHQYDTLDEMLEHVQWFMIECAYRGGDWMTILHSSALTAKDANGALVFAAAKGSGKSTLTYLLQQHGFLFLADDVVPVHGDAQLIPMPMCQRMKAGSWPLLKQQSRDVATQVYARNDGQFVRYVPPITGSQALWQQQWPVHAMIFPKYQSGVETNLKMLTPLNALEALCQSGTVFGGAMSQNQLQALIHWIKKTPAYTLQYSQLDKKILFDLNSLLA